MSTVLISNGSRKCVFVQTATLALCCLVTQVVNGFTSTNYCRSATANGMSWWYEYTKSYGSTYADVITGVSYQKWFDTSPSGTYGWSGEYRTVYEASIPSSTEGAITVPSKLGGSTITVIGSDAFYNCSKLTSITIPSSITYISDAFEGCGKLKKIIFQGNAPSVYRSSYFDDVNADCTAYVMPTSTGWGVSIPGAWKGIKIDYMKCIKFNANGGTVSATDRYLTNGDALGTLPTPTRTGYTFEGWYTAASGGTKLAATTTVSANTTCYAHWTANSYTIIYNANGGSGTTASTTAIYDNYATIAANGFSYYAKQFIGWATEADGHVVYNEGQRVKNLTSVSGDTIALYAVWETLVVPSPEVSAGDRTVFCGDSCLVTLSCPLDSAAIYYSTNGVTPRTSAAFAYTEPFVIYGSTDIIVIAVKDGVRSDYTRVSITQITPDAPVIVPADGAEFRSATCEVAISCATDGAEIYYTIDGSTPQKENGTKYTAPFTIADTTTIKAIAIGGPLKSEVITATISKRSLSLAEAVGMVELVFDTDENAPWHPIVDVSAASGFAAQSGTIGMDSCTWMETSVRGAGAFSFNWRVECEKDDSGGATWDRLVVFTNAVEAARIDGVTEWQNVSFVFEDDGKHTIRWEFVKDDYDEEGATFADNAWVSGVSWLSNDPIPAIEESTELRWALSRTQDKEKLSEKLTSVAAYQTFRNWVDGKGLGHATVATSPNAWLSYALDAPGVMAKATPIVSEDVSIDAITPPDDVSGAFDLLVGVADVEIGAAANLAEVFGVEGATELDEAAFSSDGLSVTLQRTTDGKAKATVVPDGAPPTFFLRVKVK